MNKLKYVLYARKSSEGEDKQVQSIDDQLKVMRLLAKQRGLTIVETIKESRSAKAPFQRVEFTKMLGLLDSGKINGILCWHINRLTRNPTEGGILQQMLQDEKILSIQTHDREYLPGDNAVLLSIETSMSNQFILDLRKNVNRGIAAKFSSGGISGVAPAGYLNDRVTKTIYPDKVRFPLIRKAFDLYLTENYSVQQILRILNDDWGYLSPQRPHRGGGPMQKTSLYQIFQNPRYAGWVPNPYDGGKYNRANFKPMITEEEFDQVQKILGKKGKPRLCASREFALKGFIKCGECGCMITAEAKKKHLVGGGFNEHTYYHCTRKRPCSQRGSIKEDELYKKVENLLCKYELTPKLYEWGMAALKDMAELEIGERDNVQVMQAKNIGELQKRLDKLLDLVTNEVITTEDYKIKSKQLTEELGLRQKEQISTQDRVKNWYEFIGKRLETLTLANTKFVKGDLGDKKDILRAIGQNPIILDGELLITPNEWMIPIKDNVILLKERLDMVGTMPHKMKKASEEAIISKWCT